MKNKFNLIWMTELSEASMITIVGAIIEGFLGYASPSLHEYGMKIAKASVEIFSQIKVSDI